ncbi:DNA helicase/exodeoxyribonuclease V, subunit B [Pelagirhabdus alkalitolerans]|uniref:ATP-dependent helicase/deoxyribonuclease subunit B n=1 Tax=Pelagirhabdus alkalitolerans TaxID=1612202 RepID=A0A1G6LND7_9BACI|nr:helicase-exonuclease AddAB subunit AddB [Pelagirhabdus alkalitolerans]SDC44644.1 DNA helicase/exodeoxyribonuclease V, subunit B [Pelagirhabdus alkalitolerans]
MSIRMLVGPVTANKSQVCVQEIQEKLRDEPYGTPIIYLVPEQMTFQKEYQLLEAPDIKGSIRAQVLSFSRLGFRVMQECGGATKSFITSTGIQMMLRKIIEEKKTDWQMFNKSIEKKGFIEQLEAMITEFKRYQVTPEDLTAQIDHEEVSGRVGSLTKKLEDLHYIYEQLTHVLAHQYIDGEDRLSILAQKVKQSNYLKNAIIYVDGFHRFTPQEQSVISELMMHAGEMTFTLTMDEVSDQKTDVDLFSQTKETMNQIKALANEQKQQVRVQFVNEPAETAPFLTHLKDHFDQRPAPEFTSPAPIQIAHAVHPRAEVEGAAQEILSLVRDHDYRYKDVAILMRDESLYHDLIKTIFKDYQIPVFLDEKRPMIHHPLIELIRSGLDVVLTNWRYDAVFRMLKTGLIRSSDEKAPLDQDAIDTLENYVLEYGVRGRHQWLSDDTWVFQRFKGFDQATQTDQERQTQEQINAYKNQVKRHLKAFDEGIREAKTVKEKAIVLYEWLETLGVGETLNEWQDQFEQNNQVEQANEQEQVWQSVIQLLDEMVEIIGDDSLSNQLFYQTLEAGLDTLTYSQVPPTLDHVVVASIDRSRLSNVKVAMLLGVNEGIWPQKPTVDTVLSEEERLLLEHQGITLADSETQQLIDDWFYIYLATTLASDRLWMSYPLSDTEGKAKMASSVIKRVQSLFPNLPPSLLLQDPEEMVDVNRFITTKDKTLAALTAQLAKYNRYYSIDDVWWSVLNWYLDRSDTDPTIETTLSSLFYRNQPVSLSEETVNRIYPKQIKASVSRMEMYHRCSYQHFAQYSLQLNERRTYKLDAPDIGQLFHEALKTITEWIQGENRQFKDISKQEAYQYANQAMTHLAPILQHQILHSSNRYQYMKTKLEKIIARATYVLSEQSRRSDFSPVGMEVGFGLPNSPLDPVQLSLPNGYDLVLRGRIDRVDQASFDDQLYLRIIDYKSSQTGLNLLDVYYGLALQMLAYLDVILTNATKWLNQPAHPAGVLYFHVHDPILSEKTALKPETIEDRLFKSYKMKGLLIDDEQIVKKMDTDLDSGHSPVIPAALKKDGSFRSGSQVASSETFEALQNYVRDMITQAGVQITTGEVDLNPYRDENRTACEMCTFKSVCQFDASIPGHDYRQLPKVSDDVLLKEMMERGSRDA